MRYPLDDLFDAVNRAACELFAGPFAAAEPQGIDVINSGFFYPFGRI